MASGQPGPRAQAHGFSRLPSGYDWQTFHKDLPSTLLVEASKASRLQMNFNLPSLPWQISHSPSVRAVIRHSTFETGWTARQVFGAHPKNNAVYCLLYSLQDYLFRRWQRTPNKVNTLAHPFNLPNVSSLPIPDCTESAEDPI
jgi:hypothetical protein